MDRGSTASSSMQPGPLPEPLIRPRVLVIDGDAGSRGRLSEMVEDMGCEVFSAESGEDGLDRAALLRPDLLAVRPEGLESQGWDLLTALEEDRRLASIPLILISEGPSARGGSYGRLNVLASPVEAEVLRDAVGRALEGLPQRSGRRVAVAEGDPGSAGRILALLRAAGLSVVSSKDAEGESFDGARDTALLLLLGTSGVSDGAGRVGGRESEDPSGNRELPTMEWEGGEMDGGPVGRPALELLARVMEALGEAPVEP